MLAAGVTKEFDAQWGDPKLFVHAAYRGHVAARARAGRDRVRRVSAKLRSASAARRRVRCRRASLRWLACAAMPQQPPRHAAATAASPTAAVPWRAVARADRHLLRRLPQPAREDGGLAFDNVDLRDVAEHAEVWEKAMRKLRGGMMPPPGARRPDRRGRRHVRDLARARARCRGRGASRIRAACALHRLNRAEYANAIEDLLGVRIDAAALLPKDDEADGFDNVASVLTVSPSFLDQYISAARVVTARALGDAGAAAGQHDVSAGARDRSGACASRACRSARAAACSSSTCSRPTATTS